MRKLVIAVIARCGRGCRLMLVLPHLIDVNQYRGQIQAELQKRLNRPVQLGQMSLGVFPLRVEVSNVTIGDDPSFHSNVPFAQVGQLNVSVKLLPLLSKNIEVDSLELKQRKDRAHPQRAGGVEFLDRRQCSCRAHAAQSAAAGSETSARPGCALNLGRFRPQPVETYRQPDRDHGLSEASAARRLRPHRRHA